VELFLAPLTARSKVREVLRGLVATRQVHTISMGHAPQFYVAGTLPEFSVPSSLYGGSYSSSAMPASAQFLRSFERDYDAHEASAPVSPAVPAVVSIAPPAATPSAPVPMDKTEEIAPRIAAQAEEKPSTVRPHFSRQPAHTRNRKPASSSSSGRAARGGSRSNGARANSNSRHGSQVRWAHGAAKNGHGTGNGNGHGKQNGSHANGANSLHKAKPAAARSLRDGHVVANGKPAAKSSSARPASRPAARRAPATRPSTRQGTRPGTRKDARTDARSRRKPALTASAKAGNRTRYGFTAASRQRSKKRG
jgi:hypothetical protein